MQTTRTSTEEGHEQNSLKEMYQDNFKTMIKEVFRQKNDPKDIKQMYDKIKLLIQPKAKTQYLIPGQSFIIPNKEWHKLQNKVLNKDQTTLISDQ